jgi:WD40 repeat protein
MTSRKDCEEDISDVKFSPDGHMLAVGSHDNYIDIYATAYVQQTKTIAASFSLRHLKRCRGHTSYVTHLDWSEDNRLIRSTCGAYELMYWDVSTGKQSLSSYDTLEADTEWHTHTCVLGFHVMGIWPKNADGTDVNSIDVSKNKKVIVVGDDFGNISLFNFPCIAKNAQKRVYGGHSSHVMNIKFASSGTTINCDSSNGTGNVHQCVLSGGGNDNSVMVWNISNRE